MKNTKRAAELLAELRALAENDFERHRIDVLEKDLTNPPKVEVIDDNHQKFNDVVYYKKQHGYYVAGTSIHRIIWEYYYGTIPQKFEVHHKNLNPADNDISNLQLLAKSKHCLLHSSHAFLSKKTKDFICEHCGRHFTAFARGFHKYCPECIKHKIPNNIYKKVCPVCNKEFYCRNKKQKCCCKSCGKIFDWRNRKNLS